MYARMLAFVSFFFLVSSVYAQPDSLWSRTYGGDDAEICQSIRQTTDGGYILAGYTDYIQAGSGMIDFCLVKASNTGNMIWYRAYGGSNIDKCYSVQQTSDGGYVLGGCTWSYGAGRSDYWLVRTNADGEYLWDRTFGRYGSESCKSIQQTIDGGCIMAGYTTSFANGQTDVWLVKTEANGDSLWSRSFGGEDGDYCEAVYQAADGGYLLAGYTYSFGAGGADFWLLKTNSMGDSLWSCNYGGSNNDICHSALLTTDGGYVLAGYTESFGNGVDDYWILKTDANGDSLWSRTFGGEETDRCYSVTLSSDGGYVLAGYSESYEDNSGNLWLVKVAIDGDSLWCYECGSQGIEYCFDIQTTSDGGYIMGGEYVFWDPQITADFWLVKTGPDPIMDTDEYYVPHASSYSLSVYPNPFNSELTLDVTGFSREVRVSLLNVLGQEVEIIHDGVLSGNRIHYAAPSTMSSGLYFVQARDAREVRTTKVVYMK